MDDVKSGGYELTIVVSKGNIATSNNGLYGSYHINVKRNKKINSIQGM